MRLQLLTLFCLSLGVSVLAQAPLDADNYCRTNPRLISQHSFPDDVRLLLDSHSYQNLLQDSNPVWIRKDLDGDGAQWIQRGGICQYELRACNYARSDKQENWVFTQFVSYLDPLVEEVYVNISFRFSQCTGNPACTNDFVKVYCYDAEAIDIVGQTDEKKYTMNLGTLQQVGLSDNEVQWKFKRPADSSIKGFYMGFKDIGTCGQVKRIIVYHKQALGYRDDSKLVTCPVIPLPTVGSGRKTTKDCVCDANAVHVTPLARSCDEKGACTGGQACACKAGYELSKEGVCTICPPGTFKATVSNEEKCTPCPLNSVSLFDGAEECECDCNTVRPRGMPGADCKRPPSSPLVANDNPPTFEGDNVKISWLPATDDGGSPGTLHYNVYTYNKATNEYHKANQVEIRHSTGLISYDLSPLDSSSVVVTSATSATGDEEIISDLSEVQNRYILFYIIKTSDDIEQPVTKKPEVTVPEDVVLPSVQPDGLVVEPEVTPPLHFKLGSTVYLDGSTVSLSGIREGDNGALLCITDNADCCRSGLAGEFYYPNDSPVPVRAVGHRVYRNRGNGFIRLNYYGSGSAQTGLYRCDIPDSSGSLQSIFINIVP